MLDMDTSTIDYFMLVVVSMKTSVVCICWSYDIDINYYDDVSFFLCH